MPEIVKKVSLAESTRAGYQIGGEADFYLTAHNVSDIKFGLDFARDKNIPYFVLGNGCNVLASDKGFHGIIIDTRRIDEIIVSENSIKAGAGAHISSFVREAALAGFAGVEELAGIPGTIGGGIVMNAGAFSQKISDKISQICIYDCDSGLERIVSKEDVQFEYRSSIFKKKNYIIIWANFLFTLKVAYGVLVSRQNEVLEKRKKSQPLEYRSCGSVFKNPPDSYAGKLIEQAGLKGFSVGDAQISEKHGNFIINKGNATAEDIRKIIAEVRKVIVSDFSTQLEPELIFLGEFDTKI
ncbi:MAG: UDP-N-acetylmuramate dehydrogenase [Chitinispirillales bacterium]|jgi:UDP-N-acetylmuramate dehydrogenase|nr:UDP-N-acetylmuramate dehydrogenase [Chitinispirillales bacterium]